jgi:hypothetical protein
MTNRGKQLQAKLEAVFFSLSLSGLTRQSRDFGQSQNRISSRFAPCCPKITLSIFRESIDSPIDGRSILHNEAATPINEYVTEAQLPVAKI